MKKYLKKFLLVCITLLMIVSVIPKMVVQSSSVLATQSQAVSWANSQIGKSLDYDGVYGAQCVDLIKYYYSYLGVSPVNGNGCDYATNKLPNNSWNRIKYYNGFVPQPGDIAVWTYASSAYGHVAIITSANSSSMNVVEQNGSTQVTKTHSYSYSYGTFYGVIRPNFKANAAPSYASISLNDECFSVGESIVFTLNSDTASNYWYGLDSYDANGNFLNRVDTKQITSGYSINYLSPGYYSVYVTASNTAGGIDSEKVYFSVDPIGHYINCGNWFRGTFLHLAHWKHIINDENGNVCIDDGIGSAREVWQFNRQPDGSYTIRSDKDGKALQVNDSTNNVDVGEYTGNASQRWYIYNAPKGYYLRAKSTSQVLDVYQNLSENLTNIQIFNYHGGDSQIFTFYMNDEVFLRPTILSVAEKNPPLLTWEDVPGEAFYWIKIWQDNRENGSLVFEQKNVSGTEFSIRLPAGNYEACVHAYNYWGGYDSNTVAFTVDEQSILGDVNSDTTIDAADAVMILRYDSGLVKLTEQQLKVADVTGDGSVDAADAIRIQRYDAGIITKF